MLSNVNLNTNIPSLCLIKDEFVKLFDRRELLVYFKSFCAYYL